MIQMRLTDPRGTVISAQTGTRGWLPPDFDLLTDLSGWAGGVGVRGEKPDRMGHGTFRAPTYRTGRSITLGVQVDRTEPGVWERMVSGLFSGGGMGTLEVTADGLTLSCAVQLDGEVKPRVHRDFEWGMVEIPLYAPDPWLYAPLQSVTSAPPSGGAGLTWPLSYPLDYGQGSEAAAAVLVNRGNADAWPIFWPRGTFPTGFRIIQDGHVIEWTGAVSNVPIAVDTARSAVEIQGADYSPWLVRDDFRPIPPGGSASIRFEPLGGGQGYLEATVASTYI